MGGSAVGTEGGGSGGLAVVVVGGVRGQVAGGGAIRGAGHGVAEVSLL